MILEKLCPGRPDSQKAFSTTHPVLNPQWNPQAPFVSAKVVGQPQPGSCQLSISAGSAGRNPKLSLMCLELLCLSFPFRRFEYVLVSQQCGSDNFACDKIDIWTTSQVNKRVNKKKFVCFYFQEREVNSEENEALTVRSALRFRISYFRFDKNVPCKQVPKKVTDFFWCEGFSVCSLVKCRFERKKRMHQNVQMQYLLILYPR